MATPAQKPATAKPPAGFDVAKARSVAPQVLSNLVKARDRYDRNLLKIFQVAAGIASDGLYGGGARGALLFYLGNTSNPPAPFFKPTTTQPYPWTPYIAAQMGVEPVSKPVSSSAPKPATATTAAKQPVAASTIASGKPPAGFDVGKAKTLAPQVAANLQSRGISKYDRTLLRSFQVAAGIASDGLYGGGARGALIFYGVANPPAAFFKPTQTVPYPWTRYIAEALGKVPPATTSAKPTTSSTPQKPPVSTSTGKPKPTPIITVTGPQVVDVGGSGKPTVAEKAQPDPFATHAQTEEFEPVVSSPAAQVGTSYTPSVPMPSRPVAESASDADADAPAPESASAPASGGGGLMVAALLAGLGYVGYRAVKGRKRKMSMADRY